MSGPYYEYNPGDDIVLNPDEAFTPFEMGLVGLSGTSEDAPVLEIISKGKGPGQDGIVDLLIHRIPDLRD
jgi:hypothetical protein